MPAPLTTDRHAERYADFHPLPVYRCYVHGVQTRSLGEDYLRDLDPPLDVDLVPEPDNRRDRRAVAVYLGDDKLGYVPKDDTVLLGKLARRGLPVSARLIGVQPDEERNVLSLEVLLLYPPHPATDEQLDRAESDRRAGLARVADKPADQRRPSADPLSAGHVYAGYYAE